MGRPSTYSTELANELCSRIGQGNSLRKVCESDDMPSTATHYYWMQNHPEYSLQYARAKADSADSDADRIEEIAEKVLAGEYEANAARVAIDALKWATSKKRPKKYSDRVVTEHVGTIDLRALSNDDLQARLAAEQVKAIDTDI